MGVRTLYIFGSTFNSSLRYTSFDMFAWGSDQPMHLGGDCTDLLGCAKMRMEPCILFHLKLPSGKSIRVKAKPAKVIRDILDPSCCRYVRETTYEVCTITVNSAASCLVLVSSRLG